MLSFPSPAKQRHHSKCSLNALKPTPLEVSSRKVTGVRGTNLEMRKTQRYGGPAKMLYRIIKRDKRLVEVSVHTHMHAQA